MQAHIFQGALENEGIESLLHNENLSSLLKSCVSNISGVDISVIDKDYDVPSGCCVIIRAFGQI